MRVDLSRLLMPLLSTGVVTSALTLVDSAHASTLTLPVSVPLAGVQGAANAQVPAEFAKVEETRSFLGGLLSVNLVGTVSRAGHVSVKPSADGAGLVVSVPIRADFRATPGGVGSFLARDFGGSATVSLTLVPYVTPGWEAGVKVSSTYEWTDPLSVELVQGAKVSVQSLVDTQVRAQLDGIAADVEKAVRDGANLRVRAGTLWARAQQPWTLPLPEPAYALVKPTGLSVTPFKFTPDALKLTVGASFDLSAGLGRADSGQAGPVTPSPLPPLNVAEALMPGIDLIVPVRLPYPELSATATKYAAQQTFPLPVPTSPTLKVLGVTLKPLGGKLSAAVRLQVTGPLGLRVQATSDVTGIPVLDATGRILTLSGVKVTTRREGMTGRVISWLADDRAQAYIQKAARFDLGAQLEKARGQIQALLPFTPIPGVQLAGSVGQLKLKSFAAQPDALVVVAATKGNLTATLNAANFVPTR